MSGRELDALVRAVLEEGIGEGVFPCASACVIHRGRCVARIDVGRAAVEPEPEDLAPGMLFDVASLTKVIAATPVFMRLVADDLLDLDAPLADLLPDAGTLSKMTARQLLAHCSGLADWRPLFRSFGGDHEAFRAEVFRKLRTMTPDPPPGTREIYSDLGFMVLLELAEQVCGRSFRDLVDEWVLKPLGLADTFFVPLAGVNPAPTGRAFVPTDRCPWRGRILRGEVQDENAWAMGGVAAHAGLFSTADDVARFGQVMLDWFHGREGSAGAPSAPRVVRAFFSRAGIVEGSDRCLGWDAPTAGASSSGRHFPPASIGHTGFTGTSLWIDLEREVAAALLSNRVHPVRENPGIRAFRPRFHDAFMGEIVRW